jgi:hypothetical protein
MTLPANVLTEVTKKEFLERFYDCDDGVVRGIDIVYPYGWFTRPNPTEIEKTRVNILLSVRDKLLDGGWCNLILMLSEVQELRVAEPHGGYNSVLSDGLKLAWFDRVIFIDLSLNDNDLKSIDAFRRSNRYLGAKELHWRVEEYDR